MSQARTGNATPNIRTEASPIRKPQSPKKPLVQPAITAKQPPPTQILRYPSSIKVASRSPLTRKPTKSSFDNTLTHEQLSSLLHMARNRITTLKDTKERAAF